MTPDRCPSCHAALAAGSQWCTLCYAELRPARVQVPAAQQVAAPAPVAPVAEAPVGHAKAVADPLTDPLYRAEIVAAAIAAPRPSGGGGRHALRPEDIPAVDDGTDAGVSRPGWPCQRCGQNNPLAMTECTKCGSSFLAEARSTVRVQLPIVGDVTEMSTGGRFALMAGGAVLISALFLGVLVLLAAIF